MEHSPAARGRRAALAVLLTSLIACSSACSTHASSPPKPEGVSSVATSLTAELTVARTGGLAGMADVLVIHPDGSWTRTSRRSAPVHGRLAAPQLRALAAVVENADLGRPTRPDLDKICCDQFQYRFTYADQRYETVAAQVPAPVGDLLTQLRPLLDGQGTAVSAPRPARSPAPTWTAP